VTIAAVFLIVFVPMLIETAISARHDRGLRALGAVEPAGDVYRVMAVVYPCAFAAIIAEGAWRGVGPDGWFVTGVALFAAAKAVKYWAIASLGSRWTFRVLVPPGSTRIQSGPYRWLSHPNYVAVAAEIAAVAIAMHARIAGPVAVAGFGVLMLLRIRVEETALAER
jgi:methyltransferase